MIIKDWLDTSDYPFTSRYFNINGQRLHYIDEGNGDILLFVHGTPSWSFDFRHLIKHFSKTHRCVAIDHIGFGLSDKPAEYDYSTLNHSLTLEQFALALNLSNITLLVHDFGGPIGLNFAIQHPERIKQMIILNSWLWSSNADPDYIKFRKVLKSPLLSFLYKYLNFSPRFILPRSFGEKKLSKPILKHYTAPFSNKYERNGTLAFAHSLLNDQDWFEMLWTQRFTLVDKPVLLIWGMKDPVIKPHYLKKFESGFINSSTYKLSTCGHFPQEECPEEVIDCLSHFLQ